MNRKYMTQFTYTGLGFPIILPKVEMIFINDEWHPKLNIKKIAHEAAKMLINQKTRLTGNQIKFIRTYLDMSLRTFSLAMNESHMAIKKWEDFKNQPTHMDKNIEIMLRLYLYEKIILEKKNTLKNKQNFYSHFVKIRDTLTHHAN